MNTSFFKKTAVIFFLIAITTFFANAQEQKADTIFFYETGLPSFSYKNKLLPPRHLFYILSRDQATEPYRSLAKNNHRASTVLNFSGGFLLGWQMGRLQSGKEIKMNNVVIGAGLIFLALPFRLNYIKHAKTAASIYNKNITQPQTSSGNITFSTCMNEYGATLKIHF